MKKIGKAVLSLLFSLASAHAELRIHASTPEKAFYTGKPFVYEFLIEGAKEVKADAPPESDVFQIQFLEIAKGHSISHSSIALRYKLIPTQPGHCTLPPFSFTADGKTHFIDEEKTLFVKEPEKLPGLAITRDLPQRNLYVGEPFRIHYQWKSPLPLIGFRALDLNFPLFYHSHFQVRSPHNAIDGNDKAAIGLPVSHTRLIARHGSYQSGDLFFNTVSFEKVARASKPGEQTIPSASLLASYVDPPDHKKRIRGWQTNYPSYFNNNFFDQVDGDAYSQYYITSPAQSLHILPLPETGMPQDFHGQVGSRTLSVTAAPKIVAAGDPITLTIKIQNVDFPEFAELPELNKLIAFQRQFAIPNKQAAGRINNNSITFIRTVRPKSQDVTTIPSLRLPYFDPKTKQYAVAESPPIPITVKAADIATAYDAQLSGNQTLRNEIVKNPRGIRHNTNHTSALTDTSSRRSLTFILALTLPPAAFVAFAITTRMHRLHHFHPAKAKAKRAYHNFKITSHSKNIDHHTLADSVRTFFADSLGLRSHAHTIDEIMHTLKQRGCHCDLTPIQTLYTQASQNQFSTHPPTALSPELHQQVITSIKCIHLALK
ncbi:BatD family protein [Rubritalea tangerina]|uniref:BatD family protein n=1 Tax=Rubritalea tangerina TaxID=430798 RepID=A0ABW4ZDQ1_9BACT